VGAGTAGCTCAIRAARKGLNVAIIERKEKKKIGDKVCGDLIGYDLITWIKDTLNLDYSKNKSINYIIDNVNTYSPNKKTVMKTKYKCAMINRHRFGQNLLKDTLKEGCKLYDATICVEPIINDNFVCGIKVRDAKTGKTSTLNSKIVVDASGAIPALRNKIKLNNSHIDTVIDESDESFSYREIRRLKKPLDDPKTAKIFMSGTYAHGGYYWYFPESKDIINIGIGIPRDKETYKLKDMLKTIMDNDSIFKDSTVISAGGGMLPTRRHLDSLVANGFMFVGDAASQINPVTGGGIALSMGAGLICADVASHAIKEDDVSESGLWKFNYLYGGRKDIKWKELNDYVNDGAPNAASDLLRIFAKNLNDKSLNFAFKNFLDVTMLAKVSYGQTHNPKLSQKMKIILKSLPRLPLLIKFTHLMSLMDKIKKLYMIYPKTPNAFPEWKKRLDIIYDEVYKI